MGHEEYGIPGPRLTIGRPTRRKGRGGKPSKCYYCRTYDRVTKEAAWVNTGCTSRRAAEEWRRRTESEENRGPDEAQRARAAEGKTFDEAYHAWLVVKEGAVSAAYFDTVKSRGDRFWLEHFGGRRLVDIDADLVEAYLTRRTKGAFPPGRVRGAKARRAARASARTVNDDLIALRELFRFCVSRRWRLDTPASDVKRRSGERRRKRRFSLSTEDEERILRCASEAPPPVEITAVRNAAGPHAGGAKTTPRTFEQTLPTPPPYLVPLIVTALYSGLRRRTLIELEWRHIDFERGEWRIPGSITKTGKDYHEPAVPRVLEELRQYRRQLQRTARVLADAEARLAPTARVFGLENPESFRRSWATAVRRAGVDIRFHDLRRCFLGRLRDLGATLETAMRLSGHESIEVVLECYRRATDGDVRKVVEAFERVGRPAEQGTAATE